MEPETKLSIIVLNYRSEKFCHQCFFSIQKYPPSVPYEIILVDNDSRDESIENLERVWSQALPIKFLKLPKNLGYGQGNEAGIKESKGEFLAILNPDVAIQEGTFDGLLAFLENEPRVGLVAPRLVYSDGTLQDSFRRFPGLFDPFLKRIPFLRKTFKKRMARFLMWDMDLTHPSRVDWVVGAFFIARRKAWKEVGGFDPRYFLFMEDTDLCRSLQAKNWEVIFHPGFVAEHYQERLSESKTILDIFRKKNVRIHIWSAFKYFWKWKGRGKF